MNRLLLIIMLCFLSVEGTMAQPNLTSWKKNNSGTIAKYYNTSGTLVSTGELADITQICYSSDSIWIKTTGMPSIFGPWSNPGSATDQDFTFRFPKNAQADATPTAVPTVFAVGVLTTGVPIFGNGDARSWKNSTSSNVNNGDGLWNGNAYYTEGVSLDTTYAGHVNQDGTYHSHATPFKLYKDFSSSVHSPIVGYAFDGYPVYGPFGYSTAMNSSSGIKRMVSSYQLKSITNRNSTSPPGPPVNATYPLGYYIEDYEYVSGLGDLDEHNGRYCVTPEYPSGTYAYFVATDNSGNPKFPYYFGSTYYGVTDEGNLTPNSTIAMPSGGSCTLLSIKSPEMSQFKISPNPVQDELNIELVLQNAEGSEIVIKNSMGIELFRITGSEKSSLQISELSSGIYFVTVYNSDTGAVETQKFIKK